jgi:hypothetical protein
MDIIRKRVPCWGMGGSTRAESVLGFMALDQADLRDGEQ